jgi:hypothetical protein
MQNLEKLFCILFKWFMNFKGCICRYLIIMLTMFLNVRLIYQSSVWFLTVGVIPDGDGEQIFSAEWADFVDIVDIQYYTRTVMSAPWP